MTMMMLLAALLLMSSFVVVLVDADKTRNVNNNNNNNNNEKKKDRHEYKQIITISTLEEYEAFKSTYHQDYVDHLNRVLADAAEADTDVDLHQS
jgi:cell division protein FtsL